jgi:hypothetical protein
MDISCVHRDILKDLTLTAEECRHPLTPHLVVLPLKCGGPEPRSSTPSLDLRLVRVNQEP